MRNYDYTEDGEGPDKIKIGVLKPIKELNPFPSPKMDIEGRPDLNRSLSELLGQPKYPGIRRFRRN